MQAEHDSRCRVAALQMQSGDSVERNLERAGALLADAARQGCVLAVLPENFAFIGASDVDKLAVAEREDGGPVQDALAAAARRHGLAIVAGSLPMLTTDAERCFGASFVIDADGRRSPIYRKIHLFDVDLPGQSEAYRESERTAPGCDVVAVPTTAGVLGLTICYDLRFPELYRQLSATGATLFSVPAAFTETTGKAHWQILLQARAIENLAWVIAAAQHGVHPNGRRTWGHSMIVDPWGGVAAELAEGDGVVVAEIDQARLTSLRDEFPVLSHRRLD